MSADSNSSGSLGSCLTAKSSDFSALGDDGDEGSLPSSLVSGYLADREYTGDDGNSAEDSLSNRSVNFPDASNDSASLGDAIMETKDIAPANQAIEEVGETEEEGRADESEDCREGDDASSAPDEICLAVGNLKRKMTDAENQDRKKSKPL